MKKLVEIWFIFLLRLLKIKEWVDARDPGALLIPFSGAFESKVESQFIHHGRLMMMNVLIENVFSY